METNTVTLHLFPYESCNFRPKFLTFTPGQEIKVGKIQSDCLPQNNNGVFICETMSKDHAVLKEENGKILIKDTKSTNGTRVNGRRLGVDEWKELKHEDVVTFGQDVMQEFSDQEKYFYKPLHSYVFYHRESTTNTTGDTLGPQADVAVEPILRKRKFEEIGDDYYDNKIKELKEKLEELEEAERHAVKRRRWEYVTSAVVGMATGAISVGVGAYFFGI
ncbi:hypothetical protein Glove_450g23 [Diversispora epigaea]|uniref:FHA domain-containing protein n=1 Tax=Diversispora epigaea TaxID=1348612 RepID=A0A397GPY1_9GLOM|nr:hypothetical protein Glove_450g23 [Diversispora epigaea]